MHSLHSRQRSRSNLILDLYSPYRVTSTIFHVIAQGHTMCDRPASKAGTIVGEQSEKMALVAFWSSIMNQDEDEYGDVTHS